MTALFEKPEKKPKTDFKQQKQHLYEYWKNSRMISNDSVLDAFMAVPRELFVDPAYRDESYADHPLPIFCGQTISQPTTVILMLQLLDVLPGQRVLEIGTGSGYNAALLAKLAGTVVTVERHEKLAEMARENLKLAGLENVVVIAGDGKKGCARLAPYDRIIVTAAAYQVPPQLKDQLAVGGFLVAPVGATHGCEMLKLCKTSPEHFQTSSHGLFSFVPLV
jgi:protein-L-isoaspartate(D-aspartate) O-methyltransferase